MSEDKILSANAWLIENYPGGPMDGMEYRVAMERYANYKTKYLQAKILAFRHQLNNLDASVHGDVFICAEGDLDGLAVIPYYDNFFGITTDRHGQ